MRLFTRLASLAALVAVCATSASVSAATIYSDDFDKPAGNLVGTASDIGGAWTQTGTATATPIQVNANSAVLDNSGQDAYAAFSQAAPNLEPNRLRTTLDLVVNTANAAGDYFLHVSSPSGTTTNFYQRLFARSSGAGYQLGLVDTAGTGSTTTWGSTVLTFGQSYDVEILWDFQTGAQNDDWIVRVGGLNYLMHSWTTTAVTAQEPTQLTAVNLRQGTAGNNVTVRVDNLVVDYIPEPASFMLFSVAMIGMAGMVRRGDR